MTRRTNAATFDIDEVAPFQEWGDLLATMDYRYDEHVTIIGPTGRGKTTLALEVLQARRNVAILATKPVGKDSTLVAVSGKRGPYLRTLSVPSPAVARRFVVWPRMDGIEDTKGQAAVMKSVMDQMFREGNRAVLVDEVHYFTEFLHMGRYLKLWWTQGRSIGLSLVAGFQRPAWVPRDAYSSATHIFIFGTNEREDIRAISGFGGMSTDGVRFAVAWLASDPARFHQFLYINTRTGIIRRSTLRK